jgi:eukaryotic-like serine/threonine-protein kinase
LNRTDPSARDERLYEALLEHIESSEKGLAPDSGEWLARHPEFASELQEFLETQSQIESLVAPVRQVTMEISRATRPGQTPVPAAAPISPPVGPARAARRFEPETRRFADELAVVLHGRLLAGCAIATAAFAVLVLVELASPRGGSDYLSLTLYGSMAALYAVLLTWLVRQRDISLSRLRVIEVLGLTAYAAHYAWKDFHHYSRYWEALRASEQWLLVSHSCLNWVFLIFIYGVLVPNDWRRSLRILTGMALIPLAVYAASWLSLAESSRPAAPIFDLFAMARLMAAAVAIAVFGAHKFTTLRREAYEARTLGNYRIKHQLSSGGMGEVYLAEHRLLNRPYAIKLIRPERAADPTNRTRFEREIQAMARLTHWNTIEIIDYGHAPDGTFYYVMEYVDGLNLGELVARHGPVNPGRVVYLLRQACAALAEAHAAGLIHRDIKPGNIMVTQQAGLADVVKVLDFGLVQNLGPSDGEDELTQSGMVVGTPGYISPEQAAGVADARSDIYGLGAVGYFLLCGQVPFPGRRMQENPMSPILEPTPLRELRPEVPADLEAVILRCLRRYPAERFADIQLVDQAMAACDCADSWNSAEAAAWWRDRGGAETPLPPTHV